MKLALLADIHGNYLALRAVLSAAANAGVERLLIAGDVVGYYFEPARVWELLQEWNYHAVRGNHEEMLQKIHSDPNSNAAIEMRYGSGLREAIRQFSVDQLNQLCQLPPTLPVQLDGCRILLCHGSPWDTNQYIYPNAPVALLERCAISGYDVVVLGHTHYPMKHRLRDVLIVNPGSVGQARNRVIGAHWALLDTATLEVDFHVEPYELDTLVDDCRRRHPDLPYLAEVLTRT